MSEFSHVFCEFPFTARSTNTVARSSTRIVIGRDHCFMTIDGLTIYCSLWESFVSVSPLSFRALLANHRLAFWSFTTSIPLTYTNLPCFAAASRAASSNFLASSSGVPNLAPVHQIQGAESSGRSRSSLTMFSSLGSCCCNGRLENAITLLIEGCSKALLKVTEPMNPVAPVMMIFIMMDNSDDSVWWGTEYEE